MVRLVVCVGWMPNACEPSEFGDYPFQRGIAIACDCKARGRELAFVFVNVQQSVEALWVSEHVGECLSGMPCGDGDRISDQNFLLHICVRGGRKQVLCDEHFQVFGNGEGVGGAVTGSCCAREDQVVPRDQCLNGGHEPVFAEGRQLPGVPTRLSVGVRSGIRCGCGRHL